MPAKAPVSQVNPLNGLWEELAAANTKAIAKRSGAIREGKTLRISAIGQSVVIDSQNRAIQTTNKEPAHFLLKLVLLQYLLNARDLPPAGKLVNPRELAGGDFFFRGPHTFKLCPLEEKFGRDKEDFLQTGLRLGGQPQHSADASFTLPALPRIPLTYVLWCADEEFPAKINVLFDASAEHQLPLDMLWVLVNLTSKQLSGVPLG